MGLKPNVSTFRTLMDAWLKSRHPDAVERVQHLLDEMRAHCKNGDTSLIPVIELFTAKLKD